MPHGLTDESRADEPFDNPPSRWTLVLHTALLPAYIGIICSYLLASGSSRAVKRLAKR